MALFLFEIEKITFQSNHTAFKIVFSQVYFPIHLIPVTFWMQQKYSDHIFSSNEYSHEIHFTLRKNSLDNCD